MLRSIPMQLKHSDLLFVEFLCALLEILCCHLPRICESRDRSKQTRVVKLIRDLEHTNCFREKCEEDAVVVRLKRGR